VADEQKGPEEEKSLEMRVSELEDKLAQVHVTEDEMRAFQKVSQLMGMGGQAAAAPAPAPAALPPGGGVAAGCIVDCAISSCWNECLIRQCTIVRQCTVRQCTIRQCTIVRACTVECFECGGGCAPGGGGLIGGGGFGTLGG
jgi:hypothetical protein